MVSKQYLAVALFHICRKNTQIPYSPKKLSAFSWSKSLILAYILQMVLLQKTYTQKTFTQKIYTQKTYCDIRPTHKRPTQIKDQHSKDLHSKTYTDIRPTLIRPNNIILKIYVFQSWNTFKTIYILNIYVFI